jgi:vesicle transport through interaction with t-SNAREs 1
MADTSSSSTSFERYDDEFSSLLQQIQSSLDQEPPSPYTQGLLQQCDDLVKQMALEARSVNDASLKRDLLAKVRTCKSQYQALQQQNEKQSLWGGRTNNNTHTAAGTKERLLLQQNENSLAAQNETLERARRTMQETEAVALEITEELGHNRETLMSAHGRIREVSGLTGRAKRILTSMNQRAMQQKCITYGIAIGLCVAFFMILWSMWR